MERKLASVQRILDIQPIDGADKIVKAQINGWWVVTAKDNGFNVGDLVIYLEIDSWVPHSLAPFLSKGKEPREFEGVQGERLRTIRLRGQLSQGMILPLSVMKGPISDMTYGDLSVHDFNFEDGEDVTEALGILKWEAPINAQLQGKVRGNFPSYLRKSDQERAQNLVRDIFEKHKGEHYEATMKLDGSSMTVYYYNDGTEVRKGVCSKNMDLDLNQEGNTFVDTAKRLGLLETLEKFGMNIALQGELMGPGIQKNRENLKEHDFYLYNIFDIDNQKFVNPDVRSNIMFGIYLKTKLNLKHVPHVADAKTLSDLGITDLDGLLEQSNNLPSINHEFAEGIVYKSYDSGFQFKVISNKYLEKEKD